MTDVNYHNLNFKCLKKNCKRASLIFLNNLIKIVMKFHSFLPANIKEKDIEDEN